MAFDPDVLLRPWLDAAAAGLGGPLELYDAHTHIGANDPDRFRQSPPELLERLRRADGPARARAAVFPMHEPDGYRQANDAALAAARDSDSRLVAFCRVDPRADAVAEATRALDAGARGIKLHPRAEGFTLAEPAVRELAVLAHARRVPILIHAGRGIPALGRDTVALATDFPGATLILAHAAISDLAWLWRVLPDHPNVLVDTAWWSAVDLVALFTLAPPGNVVWASDSPYGSPVASALSSVRCALQAGLSGDQVRAIAGGQFERVLAGEPPLDLGPALGPAGARALDPVCERIVAHLLTTIGRAFGGADIAEPLELSRLACAVGEGAEQSAVCAQVLELLDLFDTHLGPPPPNRPTPLAGRFLIAALAVARTPDAPLPARPEAPRPTREEAEETGASY